MWDTLIEALFGALTREQRLLLMRVVWVGLVSFHMFWVCGWLAFTGLDAPFAKSADLKSTGEELKTISQQLTTDRVERLDLEIQRVRQQQCEAASGSPARQNYTERLILLSQKYVDLTLREPHVPRCDEV